MKDSITILHLICAGLCVNEHSNACNEYTFNDDLANGTYTRLLRVLNAQFKETLLER